MTKQEDNNQIVIALNEGEAAAIYEGMHVILAQVAENLRRLHQAGAIGEEELHRAARTLDWVHEATHKLDPATGDGDSGVSR